MTQYANSFDDTLPFSDNSATVALAANTELTYTIPGDSSARYRIAFSWSYNANVWVSVNQTVVVPTGGTLNGSARTEYRPGADGSARFVRGGDVLHFISDAISNGGFTLLQLPS